MVAAERWLVDCDQNGRKKMIPYFSLVVKEKKA